MKILQTGRELSPEELYFLTMAPTVQKMSDAKSQIIEIETYAVYSDLNSKDEEQEILSIMTPEREVFATNSPTFKDDFLKMNKLFSDMGSKVNSIKVVSGFSKNDREFITCVFQS